MGWWKAEDGADLGDGPFDLAEEFLERFAQEYEEGLGRQPRLPELLLTMEKLLDWRGESFFEGSGDVGSVSLSVRIKRRPRKQPLRAGDVFMIPLGERSFAFARLTPQHAFAEFFEVKGNGMLPRAELRTARVVRFPFLIDLEPLESWRWRVIDHVPVDRSFTLQHFILGSQATCNEKEERGFVDVSAALRPATMGDTEKLPKMSIANEAYLLEQLKIRLQEVSVRRP